MLKISTITNELNSLVKQLLHSKSILPVLTTSSTVPTLDFRFWIFLVLSPLIVGETNLKDARNYAIYETLREGLLTNANLKSKIG
ncbi:hypothetical protein A6769_31580 [Nostoc punctiforme NIES-2108]|uniref:Uncharacterized protein n=1 Tax=Nostoc punctiforme NIES-2108 TaxID=1356359 RepID=A0A367R3P3_NOSPU|nr:hypothetical protein A6769_31580 [Nostoc punctiforme NIES-2108]